MAANTAARPETGAGNNGKTKKRTDQKAWEMKDGMGTPSEICEDCGYKVCQCKLQKPRIMKPIKAFVLVMGNETEIV